MTYKPDEQKIKNFLKRLNEMHIELNKGTSLTKIAEICKDVFTIESEESIDEAFGVEVNGSVYYDNDAEGIISECEEVCLDET